MVGERIVRRGVDAEDDKWFSGEAVSKLQTAQEEVEWLINRDYNIASIIRLIGDHYQFSSRQRNALQRSTSSKTQCEKRKSRLLSLSDAKGGPIHIDGFNLIITLEVALSKGILILGNDGAIRDLAGLRGTYHLIDKTDEALKLIGEIFDNLKVQKAIFFLDAPVSNSGRLKSRILQHASNWGPLIEVELVPNADPILSKMGSVVTSDSIILDHCMTWFNLSEKIISNYIKDARIIDLSGK